MSDDDEPQSKETIFGTATDLFLEILRKAIKKGHDDRRRDKGE